MLLSGRGREEPVNWFQETSYDPTANRVVRSLPRRAEKRGRPGEDLPGKRGTAAKPAACRDPRRPRPAIQVRERARARQDARRTLYAAGPDSRGAVRARRQPVERPVAGRRREPARSNRPDARADGAGPKLDERDLC